MDYSCSVFIGTKSLYEVEHGIRRRPLPGFWQDDLDFVHNPSGSADKKLEEFRNKIQGREI